MAHRSHEWPETLRQLRLAFARPGFAVHEPVPPPFGDEGAPNHLRLCAGHDSPGVEVFVHGEAGGPFPARQHREASAAVARRHGVDGLFVQQSSEAIAAGAFHNDVVAVANERVLFAHEQAFAGRDRVYADLRERLPEVEIVEVPASAVSLPDAVSSHLFNVLVDDAKLDRIAAVVEAHWPDRVLPDEHATLGDWPAAERARRALLEVLDLTELVQPSG